MSKIEEQIKNKLNQWECMACPATFPVKTPSQQRKKKEN